MSKPENQVEEDKLILVYYISIANIENSDISRFLEDVTDKISIDKESIPSFGIAFTIPTYGETRIECINPKYIVDGDLIKKHERLMAELHETMKDFVNNNKNNKKENE